MKGEADIKRRLQTGGFAGYIPHKRCVYEGLRGKRTIPVSYHQKEVERSQNQVERNHPKD